MKSPYPFDPYDWATITPLFEARIEAPILDGGFMDWLERWNFVGSDSQLCQALFRNHSTGQAFTKTR